MSLSQEKKCGESKLCSSGCHPEFCQPMFCQSVLHTLALQYLKKPYCSHRATTIDRIAHWMFQLVFASAGPQISFGYVRHNQEIKRPPPNALMFGGIDFSISSLQLLTVSKLPSLLRAERQKPKIFR